MSSLSISNYTFFFLNKFSRIWLKDQALNFFSSLSLLYTFAQVFVVFGLLFNVCDLKKRKRLTKALCRNMVSLTMFSRYLFWSIRLEDGLRRRIFFWEHIWSVRSKKVFKTSWRHIVKTNLFVNIHLPNKS